MRKLLTYILLCVVATAMAQSTARKFTLSNSSDGASELYVYLPAKENATGRCIVNCPGGGYTRLSMENEGHNWAEFYNSKGIAFVVLKYRMPNGDRTIPLSDAYNAIRTVRDSATIWNINPQDVGIQGFSAGGHLASAVSTHAPMEVRPNFSILFYPVISMNERVTHKESCVGFLGDKRNDEKLVREWSSDYAVRRHATPPAIILMSNDDGAVPTMTNGVMYYNAMRRAGNSCTMMVYPSGGHGWGFKKEFRYHELMKAELTAWLEQLPSPGLTDTKVACIGNSITDGHGIDMAEKMGYPAVLMRRLGTGYQVKNFGVSARTMINKGDHPYMNEVAWRDCLAWQPNIVVVKLGTNDSKDSHRQFLATDYQRDMQQLIDSLKALPTHPRIILCTPIPAIKETWTISDSVITNVIIPLIRKVADNNDLEVLDLHSSFNTDKTMQSDGIHPNDKGAAAIAALVAEQIKTPKINAPKKKIKSTTRNRRTAKL